IVHYLKHGTLARLHQCYQDLLTGLFDPSSMVTTIRNLAHLNAQLSQQVSFLLFSFFFTNLLEMIIILFVLANSGDLKLTFSSLAYLLVIPIYIWHILSVDRQIQSCLEKIAIA